MDGVGALAGWLPPDRFFFRFLANSYWKSQTQNQGTHARPSQTRGTSQNAQGPPARGSGRSASTWPPGLCCAPTDEARLRGVCDGTQPALGNTLEQVTCTQEGSLGRHAGQTDPRACPERDGRPCWLQSLRAASPARRPLLSSDLATKA